ncbi:Oidioi.mRNA.OKI2018_I69.chr2.g4908.t1.cds [Oikopleura dioica]|uniref:Oidioi.mRNA.OKI2018_I69.chr2.g4908.t1.cds n=1 Tax=Oikopleura dioica TaxID=34765 RepID=A0ABN7SYV7_OIKDI|nr:Oidioi.mRNA.OKI2018_I69.chr2.g4908.t1.cds [Oikopleura dioica]
MSEFDDPANNTEEWENLLINNQITPEMRRILECTDRRMNGMCRCIQKSILGTEKSAIKRTQQLHEIIGITSEARRLKNVRQEEGEIENGRRYSRAYIAFVEESKDKLGSTGMRFCKKAIVKILRCSLNFLYTRNTAPKARRALHSVEKLSELKCCAKNCIRLLLSRYPDVLEDFRQRSLGSSKERRELYYDMRDHASQPCDNAIREIVQLSKATINNLRAKSRHEGVPHGAHGKKKHHAMVGSTGELMSPATPLTPATPLAPALTLTPCTPTTPSTPAVFSNTLVDNFKRPATHPPLSPKIRATHFSFERPSLFIPQHSPAPLSPTSPLAFFSQLSPSPFLGHHESLYLQQHLHNTASFSARDRLDSIKAEPGDDIKEDHLEKIQEDGEKDQERRCSSSDHGSLKSPKFFAQLTTPPYIDIKKEQKSPPSPPVPTIKIQPPPVLTPKRSKKSRPVPGLDLISPKKSLNVPLEDSMTQTPTMVPRTPSKLRDQFGPITPKGVSDSSVFFPSH